MRLRGWLDERTGLRAGLRVTLDHPVLGGASFAYVMGAVLLFLLVLQGVTGALLAFYYSPSATDAWASVAYVEDRVTLGWLVRGLHHHGASAMVIAVGLHVLQVVIWGAYKRPREVTWWLGLLLFGLVMGFALTGDLLPWDQNGYWATKIRAGYLGASPGPGAQLQGAVQGGNDFGNLTLTRFYALHVVVLPALTVLLLVAHVKLSRRHGLTPRWGRSQAELARTTRPSWPDQRFRDVTAMAVAFAALVGFTVHTGGAGLGPPADPSAAFDARPVWYDRSLYQLVRMSPHALEAIVALLAPAVLGGVLVALPLLDRGPDRSPVRRAWAIAVVVALLGGAAALTVVSYRADAANPALAESKAAAEKLARRARVLAARNGVPTAGGAAVYTTAPWYRARTLWGEHCASCHQGDDRKGPVIGPGYNSRAWIKGFLQEPSGDAYYGRTKLGKNPDLAMQPIEETGADLDALVELIYAESGAPDVDPARVARGRTVFDEGSCADCHTRVPGPPPAADEWTGPGLAGRGTVADLTALIADAGELRFFGAHDQMPRFADELSETDLRVLAEWLIWLRTATEADLRALDE